MKKRRGFTMVEVLISLGVLTMVLTGAGMLTTSAGRSFDLTQGQLDASQGASIGVQHMMQDLEEAKQVTVNSATSITVFYPQVAADGTYIRSALDSVNTIAYYRGRADGTADAAGNSLLRQPAGSTAQVVCSGITNLQYVSTNPSSVDITLNTLRATRISTAQCNMVHRAIFLRNY